MEKIKNEFFYTEDMYKEYCKLKSNIASDGNGVKHHWILSRCSLNKWIKKNKISEHMLLRMKMRIKQEREVKLEKVTETNTKEDDAEIYEFALEIFNMKVNSTIDWEYGKVDSDILMGIKKLWMFDCLLIMSASYGGGFDSILWINRDTKPRDIYKWLMDTYIEPVINPT